ncbi:MAG TPA: glycoside hydrolase family 15 protein [Verrucomicrobiae bacterium]|nr:glycoside hydrolase family 15 protein [Verrucomicrobiae bacterium]
MYIILLAVPIRDGEVPKIDDYGIIGDCRSAALISKYGSIDWLCWPRFDSPSIFAALLDRQKGGHWSIRPEQSFDVKRAYIPSSNVLQTEFACASGIAMLTDLMPAFSEEYKRGTLCPDHELIRLVQCTAGQVEIKLDFYPRADYGRSPVNFRSMGQLGLRADVGKGAYWLRSTVALRPADDRASALFTLKKGDTAQFCLTYSEQSPSVLPALGETVRDAIERSVAWWQEWSAQSNYHGPYRDAVTRSALTLKLLAYAPSGAIVAAPTTSLPERIGDGLNWDYRYCWLRDASLTIRALLGLGYHPEAESFLTWLLHATRLTQPELRVLYNLYGRIHGSDEREVKYLDGYFDSRPVRVGNGARHQLQLDVYGEVVEATAQYAEALGGFDKLTQRVLIGFGKYVAKNWDQPDEGIWEPRSGRRNNTHSRLMCWTTLDRLLALSEKNRLEGVPREWFARERDRIRQQIESRAWNQELESYVSTLDGDSFDATLLRLAWYGFEHADSDRMKRTYEKVKYELGAGHYLLYRYRREPREGAFGVCGFWGVEHLALSESSLGQAHEAFQQLLSYQNDLGLYAEEIHPDTGHPLGNFPQAFTHIGLISAALTLAERERGKAQPAIRTGSDVKASREANT